MESVSDAFLSHVPLHSHPRTHRYILPLSPAKWKFHFAANADFAPAMGPGGFDEKGFFDIAVPMSWEASPEVQRLGGKPQYTNIKYPFPCDPPRIPHDLNNVGSYQRRFTLPSSWGRDGRRVFVCFDGVDSAAYVWLDGQLVGYTQGSRLPAEFDITDLVSSGDVKRGQVHVLSVRVYRFCDGSYLEDQDHWWLSGLHRDVYIYSKPKAAYLWDYCVRADVPTEPGGSGSLAVSVTLHGAAPNADDGEGAESKVEVVATLYEPRLISIDVERFLTDDADIHNPIDQPTPRPLAEAREQIAVVPVDTDSGTGEFAITRVDGGDEVRRRGLVAWEGAMTGRVASVKAWNPESPYLYTLVLQVKVNGRVVDIESCRFGFRTVTLDGPRLLVNGRVPMFYGVNRHDHNKDTGKAVSIGDMITDIKLMKQFNFNAVRCSHYPNASVFLDICDAAGIFVIDEANIETHGMFFQGRPNELLASSLWRDACMSRMERMVRRDRNHTSIVCWSLGNESGYGSTHDDMATWARSFDPTRVVQYESCGGGSCTDIICPMYPSVERMVALVDVNVQNASQFSFGRNWRSSAVLRVRPVILCEYSHAMGNSNGNLHKYWDAMRATPGLQGGFIWDWLDQALEGGHTGVGASACPADGVGVVTAGGRRGSEASSASSLPRPVWFYGGDFGEAIHDAQFNINGLFFPDRTPHPAAYECKAIFQPVHATLVSATVLSAAATATASEDACDDGEYVDLGAAHRAAPPGNGGAVVVVMVVEVQNRYCFSTLDGLEWLWHVEVNGAPVDDKHILAATTNASKGGGSVRRPVAMHGGGGAGRTLPAIDVGHTQPLTLTLTLSDCRVLKGEAVLVSSWRLIDAPPSGWARKGHEVARAHLSLPFPLPLPLPLPIATTAWAEDPLRVGRGGTTVPLIVTQTGAADGGRTVTVAAPSFAVTFANAAMHSLRLRGDDATMETELLVPGCVPRVELWRAPTDNDVGDIFTPFDPSAVLWWMAWAVNIAKFLRIVPDSFAQRWRDYGVDRLRRVHCAMSAPVVHANALGVTDAVDVKTSYLLQAPNCVFQVPCTVTYRVTAVGVSVTTTVALPPDAPPVARVGMTMRLPGSLDAVEWFGLGPHENYIDRCQCGQLSTWRAHVDQLPTPYIVPSESGGRTGVRWVSLKRADGSGLSIVAGEGGTVQFTASRFDTRAVDAAKHAHALWPEDDITLIVDHKHMGLGGDTSWEPLVHPEFLIDPATYSWTINILPHATAAAAAGGGPDPSELHRARLGAPALHSTAVAGVDPHAVGRPLAGLPLVVAAAALLGVYVWRTRH